MASMSKHLGHNLPRSSLTTSRSLELYMRTASNEAQLILIQNHHLKRIKSDLHCSYQHYFEHPLLTHFQST